MTDRDRLIELIYCACRDYDEYADSFHENGMSPMESFEEFAADYLIANGVTVGDAKIATTTWRPASEPPKEEGSYLVYSCKSKTVFTARYRPRCERWANRANGQFITHWMPLPQPPKEVE